MHFNCLFTLWSFVHNWIFMRKFRFVAFISKSVESAFLKFWGKTLGLDDQKNIKLLKWIDYALAFKTFQTCNFFVSVFLPSVCYNLLPPHPPPPQKKKTRKSGNSFIIFYPVLAILLRVANSARKEKGKSGESGEEKMKKEVNYL